MEVTDAKLAEYNVQHFACVSSQIDNVDILTFSRKLQLYAKLLYYKLKNGYLLKRFFAKEKQKIGRNYIFLLLWFRNNCV